MVSVQTLSSSGLAAEHLRLLGENGAHRQVAKVHVAERRDDIGSAPPDSLVILLDEATNHRPSRYLDLALRRAMERDVSALVLRGAGTDAVGITSERMSRDACIALLDLDPAVDLADFIVSVNREIHEDTETSLARLARLCSFIDEQAMDLDADTLLDLINEGGNWFTMTPVPSHDDDGLRAPAGAGVPVVSDGELQGHVVGAIPNDLERPVAERIVADALARASARTRLAEEAPIHSRFELITELLGSQQHESQALLRRARKLGIAVDGWHVTVALQADFDEGIDDLSIVQVKRDIERLAVETTRARGGSWQHARSGELILLILMEPEEPRINTHTWIGATAAKILERLRDAHPAVGFTCGVSSLHPGVSGLWTSLAEAKSAARAAQSVADPSGPAFFDADGVNQTIAEWYGTAGARRRVDALLAPLEEVGQRRKNEILTTLRAYFDNECSVSAAAQALFIHRNTVAYRIQKISELLQVDLTDSSQRLLLELACRSVTFGAPTGAQGRSASTRQSQ